MPQLQGQKRRNSTYQNRVHLIGYLGKNPEHKSVKASDRKYAVLSLATQRSWKGAGEEWHSKTEWHRVVAWNGLGEYAATKPSNSPIFRRGIEWPSRVEVAMSGQRSRRITVTIVGALVTGLTALVYSNYRQEIRAARARVSSGSQIVNTPCGPIEYAVAGNGPAVLVVHGAGGGFDQALELAQPLIDRGFQVIAVSRFGYLRTPFPVDASPMAQAEAHACVLDALKLERVAVVGGSAGAPSAMQLCLRHPERCSAMVLLFPLTYAPRAAGQAQQKPSALTQLVMKTTLRSDFAFWAATKLARNTMVKTVLATPPADFKSTSVNEQERALLVLRHILPISLREKGLWNDAAIAASVPRYNLERFRVPTLVISAEDDLYGTFQGGRYTAEHVPGARFVGYPTGGHLLMGHWKEACSEVARFPSQVADDRHPAPKDSPHHPRFAHLP